MPLHLDFYGVKTHVSAYGTNSESVLKNLASDFGYFLSGNGQDEASARIDFKITVAALLPAPKPEGRKLFSTRMSDVYGLYKHRICVHHGRLAVTEVRISAKQRLISVTATTPELAYELAYVAMLSSVGEELDKKGLHRVHALGFESAGKRGLLILPRGAGKSALAALLLERTDWKIFSDEMPLLKNGCIHPFPIRLALKKDVIEGLGLKNWDDSRAFTRQIFDTKELLPIPADRIASPGPLDAVYFAKSGGPPLMQWLSSVVVGLGLPQMAELMLRLDAPLARIAFARAREAERVWRQASFREFPLSRDANENLKTLSNRFS